MRDPIGQRPFVPLADLLEFGFVPGHERGWPMTSIRRIFMALCLLSLLPVPLAAENPASHGQTDTLILLNPAKVMEVGDYPVDALRDGAQGAVSIVLTGNAQGQLLDCKVVQSSGTEELDDKACALMRAKGRFRARVTPGNTHDVYTMHQKVRWVIVHDTPPVAGPEASSAGADRILAILTGLVSLVTLAGVILLPPITGPMPRSRLVTVPLMLVVFMPGTIMMMMVADRYRSFWPFMTGALVALAFTVIAMTLLWLRRRGSAIADDIALRVATCVVVGALYVQPLVLLVNAAGDRGMPTMVPGIVTQTYRTHGKHTNDYIVLDGPAAALGNTMSDGEFSVDDDIYDRVSLGEHVCVTVHTGLLSLRWWSLGACPVNNREVAAEGLKAA